MLMERFNEWRYQQDNVNVFRNEKIFDNFSIFYQEDCIGKGFMEILCDLAYQIYELQTCVEGLLEDNEG